MKSIFKQFLNQENAMNGRGIAIEGLLKWMKESPVLFLWLVWSIYLGLDFLVRWIGGLPFAALEIILWNYLGWGLINQFWFFVFLPNTVFLKKWKTEVSILLLVFLVYALLKLFLLGLWSKAEFQLLPFLINESVRSLQFLLYSSAIWGFYVLAISQDEFNKLEVDLIKLRIEHKSLQLSPHFVLNMVSQFSAMILKLSPSLFKSLNLFTEILSYSYKDPEQKNSLAQEVRAMENYIVCQRMRFGDKLQFLALKDFGQIQTNLLPMPKWTLMTLLENVFKHGDCFCPQQPCTLSYRLTSQSEEQSLFTMSITNPLDHSTSVKSSEFGIDAVKRILTFYFPGRFRLFIEKSSSEFNLMLYISYGKHADNWPVG